MSNKILRNLYFAIFLIILAGIALFTHIHIKNNKIEFRQELVNRGNNLATLISLYPVSELTQEKKDYFLKTLSEDFTAQGLVYCVIHSNKENNILELSTEGLLNKVPDDIRLRSENTRRLINEAYSIGNKDNAICEFAKPIFENGKRTAVVRLGLLVPVPSVFSLENLTYMGLISFLIVVTLVFLNYGATSLLQPVVELFGKIGNRNSDIRHISYSSKSMPGFLPAVAELEHSFSRIKNVLTDIEKDNMEMTTKLGVLSYQKNQIVKIIDSIDTGIIIMDSRAMVVNANNYALNLIRKKLDEVLEHPLGEVIQNNEILKFVDKHLNEDSPVEQKNIDMTFPGTSPGRVYQVSIMKLRDEGSTTIYNLISIRDITELKNIKDSSQGFIAQVAHELLTPLTTIRSYNEMLMDGEVDDIEMQKEFYNTINDETFRLTRFIQNLLSIAKLEMGGLVMQKGLIKTDWLVEDSVSAVEGEAIKKCIKISKNLPDNFPSIMGDKEMLKIAIINVLGNAVKYCPENSIITLTLLDQQEEIHFIIEDDGPGIPSEDLPHIFEKFFRSTDQNVKDKMGSGLGLAMTAEIINLHGGEVGAESEHGNGTKFTIKLPKEKYYVGNE